MSDLPWELSPETLSSIKRGLDYFEKAGQATWTKMQRGLVDAATTAINAVAQSGAMSAGVSPAAAMFSPLDSEDVGEAAGAGDAFSPEARANEDSLGLGAALATDVVAGLPTAFLGEAGAVADVTAARSESERAGMGPMGQAATTLLAAAPLIGAGAAGKLVREFGGGTADEALAEFGKHLDEASIKTPVVDGPTASVRDFDVPDQTQLNPSQRPTEFFDYNGPTWPPTSKTRNEGIRWTEEQLKTIPEKTDAGDAERFMRGLATPPNPKAVKDMVALTDSIASTLSDAEKDAIRSFTSRHGDKVGSPEWLSAVDKLRIEAPTSAGPLYRGTRMQPEALAEAVSRGEISISGPTSFSFNKDLADAFSTARESRGSKVLFEVVHADDGVSFLSRDLGIGRSGLEREINLADKTLKILERTTDDEGNTVLRLSE